MASSPDAALPIVRFRWKGPPASGYIVHHPYKFNPGCGKFGWGGLVHVLGYHPVKPCADRLQGVETGDRTGMASKRQHLLLFFHQGALGDFVMTFPALVGLRDRFERIQAVCPPENGRLAVALGLIERWYPIDAAAWSSLYSKKVDHRVHEVLNSAAAILLFSRSRDLADGVGACSDVPMCRIPPLPPPTDRVPVFRFLLDRLCTSGLLPGPAKNETRAALTVTATGSDGLSRCSNDLLIHPGAGSRRKRWPLDRFLALGDLLFDRGLQPRFLIGPAEEDPAERLVDRLAPFLDKAPLDAYAAWLLDRLMPVTFGFDPDRPAADAKNAQALAAFKTWFTSARKKIVFDDAEGRYAIKLD